MKSSDISLVSLVLLELLPLLNGPSSSSVKRNNDSRSSLLPLTALCRNTSKWRKRANNRSPRVLVTGSFFLSYETDLCDVPKMSNFFNAKVDKLFELLPDDLNTTNLIDLINVKCLSTIIFVNLSFNLNNLLFSQ